MNGTRGEWPTALQEVFTAARRVLPSRFRGYGRREVDEVLREATGRLAAAVEDADAYVELAAVLDEQVLVMRSLLDEYDRLHSGDEVCREEDPAIRDVVTRARHDAATVVADARGQARLALDRQERTIESGMAALEDAGREDRRRLALSTTAALDVVRDARSGCEELLARLVGRERVIEEWTREFADLLDVLPSFHGTVEVPRSRRPEEVGVPRPRAAETTPTAVETGVSAAGDGGAAEMIM
ncbi:hypothetical protein ACFFQW_02785 [Umezawaea endophytica]|uniref:DivIVA domain-containing protein n=1 Tax=Umezawaea endophytica TaxID=1654476 RepID=A0A9X3A5A1_9PSEU|nr:hypothetical protein [Umezawaea endophytica]MCS7482023.1 hypothetical protein [Umezawaea endophytica]